jgi:hypothetical protein
MTTRTMTTATRMVAVTMVADAEGMEGEEAGAEVVAEGEAGGEAAAAGAAVSIYRETAERNAITSRTEAKPTATAMAARDTSSSPATTAPVVGTRVEATSTATGKRLRPRRFSYGGCK